MHTVSRRGRRLDLKLEVQPAGMEMLDHIVLTFVLAEDKRRERKRRIDGLAAVEAGLNVIGPMYTNVASLL